MMYQRYFFDFFLSFIVYKKKSRTFALHFLEVVMRDKKAYVYKNQ
jgi:hypothetical protein